MTNDRNGLLHIVPKPQLYNHGMDREEANVHENVWLDVKPNVRQLGGLGGAGLGKYCNTSPGLGSFVQWRNDRHRGVRILMKISALLAGGKGDEESGCKRSHSFLKIG